MAALLALAPIALILALMVGLGWPAARAGLAGLAVTIPVAILGFDYGTATLPALGPARATAGALIEAGFTAATILWIIFPALCLYQLQLVGGAFETLRGRLVGLSDDRRLLAVLVAWFFGLFMEGAAGFGTPVALAAPILVGIGFTPLNALAIVLVGHAAGVSFGAIGTPVLPQIAATGLPGLDISRATGFLHAVLGWILLVFALRLAEREETGARRRFPWVPAGLAALCFLLPFLAIAAFVGPELPTLGGALAGGVAFVVLLRRMRARSAAGSESAAAESDGGGGLGPLMRAVLPYLVLLVLILATRLVGPLQEALRAVELRWALPGGFDGAFEPLYHPGTLLMAGFLIGGALQGRDAGELGRAAAIVARRLPPVAIALVAMLSLAGLMVHADMIALLAETAAARLGPVWPWIAPLGGVLGTFVTGSATASNILLTDFQAATAARLDLPLVWLVAAQGFGAAVGNMICPHNIVAGAATVGLQGREGQALRLTLLPAAVYVAAGGTLVFLLVS
ncbi:MAG: L-lactate permease [Azospirillaceae bacterium]